MEPTTTKKAKKAKKAEKTKKKQQQDDSEDDAEWTNDLLEEKECGSFHKGLAAFIKKYTTQLKTHHGGFKEMSPKPIVLLSLSGPILLRMDQKYEKMILETVETSKRMNVSKPQWSGFHQPLGDHLWYLSQRLPKFLETMFLLDPIGEGDCGFMVLLLFGMFLEMEQHPSTVSEMRAFLVKSLKQDVDYFKGSDLMATFGREATQTDKNWSEHGLNLSKVVSSEDCEEKNKEGLFNIIEKDETGKYPEMDSRHLCIYAKATKTRIIYLHNWEHDHTPSDRKSNHFSCMDIDWRDDKERWTWKAHLPEFSDGFDFYRTAVVMNSATSTINGDHIKWVRDQKHFTMWIPQAYNPRVNERTRVTSSPPKLTVRIANVPAQKAPKPLDSEDELCADTPVTERTKVKSRTVNERARVTSSPPKLTVRMANVAAQKALKPLDSEDERCVDTPVTECTKVKSIQLNPNLEATFRSVDDDTDPDEEEYVLSTGLRGTSVPIPVTSELPVISEQLVMAEPLEQSVPIPVIEHDPNENGPVRAYWNTPVFGKESFKGRMKKESAQQLVMPVKPEVLSAFRNRVVINGGGSPRRVDFKDFVRGEKDESGREREVVGCLICGKGLRPQGTLFGRNPEKILDFCIGKNLTTGEQSYIRQHVETHHTLIQFAMMDPWQNIADKNLVDLKSLIQESLYRAYNNGKGLDLALFAHLHEHRNAQPLKFRLTFIFGIAYSYVRDVLPNNLRKRAFMSIWAKEGGEEIAKARDVVEKRIVETGLKWIELMMKSCEEFDFSAFLTDHEGNWKCMWNSMVYFFRRGLFFEEGYPPIHAVMDSMGQDNFVIITELNSVLRKVRDGTISTKRKRSET